MAPTVLLLTFLAAFLTTLALTPVVKRLAWRLGVVALPSDGRWHDKPIPMLGGPAIIATFVTLSYCFGVRRWLIAGAAGMCVLGVIDDAIALTPSTKFLFQVPFAVLAMVYAPSQQLVDWWWLRHLLVLFWVLAATNAFNLIDGLDGLAAGLGILSALSMALIAWAMNDRVETLGALIMAGALLGFLIYNFQPASIFMGDGGSLPVGFILASMAVETSRFCTLSKPAVLAVPVLLMAVPIIDTSIVTTSRLAKGLPISKRGLDHSHHRLVRFGLSRNGAVVFLWLIGGLGCAWGIFWSLVFSATLIAALPFCGLTFGLLGLFLADLPYEHDATLPPKGELSMLGRIIVKLPFKRRGADFAMDILVISAAYYGAAMLHDSFWLSRHQVAMLAYSLPAVIGGSYLALLASGIYRHVGRLGSVGQAFQFLGGSVLAGVAVFALSVLYGHRLPISLLLMFMILLFDLLIGSRLSFRMLTSLLVRFASAPHRLLVLGAGEAERRAASDYLRIHEPKSFVVGFVDEEPNGSAAALLGGPEDLNRLYTEVRFDEILVARRTVSGECAMLLSDFAGRHKVPIRSVVG